MPPALPAREGTVDSTGRLRVPPLDPPFHIVLVEPEIPPNTGNVARIAAATSSPLHLVGKLGFRIDEHAVRRAGLDYWHLVDLRTHVDWEHFVHAYEKERSVRPEGGKIWMFDPKTDRSWYRADPRPGDALVFGKESVGLSAELMARYPEGCVALPTSGGVRSHNLANAVAIALYEGLRAVGQF
jgi:tRNA (cytidine/uridine-2'-O-)-methyltransferase